MSFWTLIFRSLRFHLRSHLGALLGAAVGSAVLLGALVVGDSVRHSLRELALVRLGEVKFALASDDRMFRAALAQEIQNGLPKESQSIIVPVLQLPATAATGDGSARANRVQLLGVDSHFWQLANEQPDFTDLPPDSLALNTTLAEQLRVKAGDTILVRVQKPSQLSRDAPLSTTEDVAVALRLRVHAVLSDAQFGRFSLLASQLPPFNAFMRLSELQTRVETPAQANLLLVSGADSLDEAALTKTLRANWQLADAQLELRTLPGGETLELRSSRIFLDAPAAAVASQSELSGQGLLTYFVNEIRLGDRLTPYSMVSAMTGGVIPLSMGDDEIILNQWAAEDLQAKAGDTVTLKYFVVGLTRKLEEREHTFKVRAIVPISGIAADRTLMPDFPGMTDADNCRDWDTGFPIKTDLIRDKDEKYWDDHRGTPKAFITLATGQKLWSNRFGDLTAIRYSAADGAEAKITASIRQNLDPATASLHFQPVRASALQAVAQAQDFGGLFIGFSFFLIVAALILMALLFQFGIEQRATEVGTLLALGFTPKQVRRLLLGEGLLIAVLGGVVGLIGGVWYAHAMLLGLSTLWRDAVGTSALQYHAEPGTLAGGVIGGVIVALFTVWLALRKQARQPARELLAEGANSESLESATPARKQRPLWIGIGATVLAVAMIGSAFGGGGNISPGAFFGAGALLLIAGLSFSSVFLNKLSVSEAAESLSVSGLGVRNGTRRRKRSLATIGLLACGSFLVVAVGANKLDAVKDSARRNSGTGGFTFWGETSIPVVEDLNTEAGRDFFSLNPKTVEGVSFVPLRVRDGDDASCLNLNRAQKPRLLGVKPELLSERGAFTFAKVADGVDAKNPWAALTKGGTPLAEDEVPAIGDMNSILWAMGKKVGDTVPYVDERGNEFKLRLVGAVANSILQGNLIIAEEEFVKRFPSESGYRTFLLDVPSNRAETVSEELSRALADVGLELTATTKRLAAFNAVQNTYLSTFQILGGLGLLLGSVGLGVVVLRNVLERRAELAVLLAVGFRRGVLRWLIVSEHGALLLIGLLIGVVSAVVAVMPALLSPGAEVPYVSLALTLGAVLVSGAIWTILATRLALRGQLLNALRND